MKLNLGCSDNLLPPEWVNVDLFFSPEVWSDRSRRMQAADLRDGWPWPESSVDEIRAWDIIEHLPDKIHTMNEAWRVLRPGGVLDIKIPTTDGPGAWQDPTHVSYWNRNSFLYYTYDDPHRLRFGEAYGIKARFEVMPGEGFISNSGVPKLHIRLRAVK